MDARKSYDFCVSVCKTNFTDHHTPDTRHDFRDLVLVCKRHDCYCTQKFRAFPFLPIKRCKRLQRYIKSNHFKMPLNVFSTTSTYSNSIVYRLFYCWKITSICSNISKTGINLWVVYTCNIKALESTYERWEKGECTLYRWPKSWEICGCTRPF